MSNEGTMIDMFKIFIVEDDTGLVNLLKEYLHKFGYMTQSVHDFETVRDQFESYGPHLVLLDINLPKYDGYYWCRQFRASPPARLSSSPPVTENGSGDGLGKRRRRLYNQTF